MIMIMIEHVKISLYHVKIKYGILYDAVSRGITLRHYSIEILCIFYAYEINYHPI